MKYIVTENDGETAFGNNEPFICDECHEETVQMFEAGGIQVCKECWDSAVAYTKAIRSSLIDMVEKKRKIAKNISCIKLAK